MRAYYICGNINDFNRVFADDIKKDISKLFDIKDKCFSKSDVINDLCLDAEAVFSTWGMPSFSLDEIQKHLPNLKYIFYAAGSVKYFAEPFLESGVRIFSSWQANAIPVIEYSISQILLANKGFYRNMRLAKKDYLLAQNNQHNYLGNYNSSVGILGFGAIGKEVAKELVKHHLNVLVFANNVTKDDEKAFGLKQASLEEIFTSCNVISNHLPNIKELEGIVDAKLLSLLSKYATFINTGRGAQIDENALIEKLKEDETFTAVLDVTNPEPPLPTSEINRLDNLVLTTHIAGSSGQEVIRMSQYMLEESKRILDNKKPLFEINSDMLKRMA